MLFPEQQNATRPLDQFFIMLYILFVYLSIFLKIIILIIKAKTFPDSDP